MTVSPQRRLASITLGGMFLGVLMILFGLLPQAGSQQPLPIWVWRTLAGGGLCLLATAAAARWSRANGARVAAMAGLALTMIPLGLLVIFSALSGRFNPFTLLLALGILGCGKGILAYRSPEIQGLFRPLPPSPKSPENSGT